MRRKKIQFNENNNEMVRTKDLENEVPEKIMM